MEIVTDVQESRSPSVVDERAWNPLLSNFVISLERIAYQFKKTCERPVLLYTFLDIFFHDIHIYIYGGLNLWKKRIWSNGAIKLC